MSDPTEYSQPSLHAFSAAMQAMMRGEHLPAAVEAREERDRARDIAVQLEQENAKLQEVCVEYRRILSELLERNAAARAELTLADINTRMEAKLLLGATL